MRLVSGLPELENQLMSRLMPVQPDPQFRKRLERRLSSPPQVLIEKSHQPLAKWAIAAGLVLGIFFLWFFRKS